MRNERAAPRRQWAIGRWLIGLGVCGVAASFVLVPGDLPDRARVALHGLCAQRPAHTFALGGTPLPFDARMTGLYLGALIAGLPLVGGQRRGTRLGWPWLALLAGLVVVMGLDGVNALRVDLGLPAWWAPDNRLRLVTGLLAGVSLGVALVWLLNTALWPAETALTRPGDLLGWAGGLLVAGAVVVSGAGWALVPLTLLLLAGALLTLLALNLATIGLIWPIGSAAPTGAASWRRLAWPATLALAAAMGEMALLAGGRYAVEAALGRGVL